MGDASISGLQAFRGGSIANHWWQFILIGIIGTSVLVGLVVVQLQVVTKVKAYLQVRTPTSCSPTLSPPPYSPP